MRILKTGDPCPFCGQPIRLTDPDALRLLTAIADIAEFPDPKKEGCADGDKIQGPVGFATSSERPDFIPENIFYR